MEFEFARERAIAELAGFFSVLSLALAGFGLYGLVAFAVGQRTREIGVRLALGAQAHDVLRLVMGRGVWLTVIGCGLGVAGALGLMRFVQSLLYGVSATDPIILGVAASLLATVALVACWLPARRAMKIDPLAALRTE